MKTIAITPKARKLLKLLSMTYCLDKKLQSLMIPVERHRKEETGLDKIIKFYLLTFKEKEKFLKLSKNLSFKKQKNKDLLDKLKTFFSDQTQSYPKVFCLLSSDEYCPSKYNIFIQFSMSEESVKVGDFLENKKSLVGVVDHLISDCEEGSLTETDLAEEVCTIFMEGKKHLLEKILANCKN